MTKTGHGSGDGVLIYLNILYFIGKEFLEGCVLMPFSGALSINTLLIIKMLNLEYYISTLHLITSSKCPSFG